MSSIPPILRFPDELLVEIVASGRQTSVYILSSEWVMSHVCRRFRYAVTAASTLWTQVTLDLCRDKSAELARLYLQRSAACRIEMNLCAMDELQVPKGIHYLIPHISRIARLTIAFETHQAFYTIIEYFRDVALPSLEHLEITSNTEDDGTGLDPPLDFPPLQMPKITSLEMTRCIPSFPPPQWMVALTHLHLRDNACPTGDQLDIFRFITRQHPSLLYLYLDLSKFGFGPGKGITSRSLTHLDLQFDEAFSDGLSYELASFDTPHLTHLGLHCTHGDQLASLFNSTRPTQSPFPAVTSLTFTNLGQLSCDCDNEELYGYQRITTPPRRLFPVMSSLTLIRECFTPRIISDLLGPSSQPWPLLEVLAPRPRVADEENLYAALQDVVRWKRSQEGPLPLFKLSPNLLNRQFWVENGVNVGLLENDDGFKGRSTRMAVL
ncbi:hypothetical protein FB45DRAFT_918156 [Roridomyces roridus]|uniref:F-box domain-containing protein n=1 Tax=Roridomyces roridus TaxID=1738132 RepID=A0AAD7FMH6_9AGAR|nr:hypothetical protein FB45DRAFT_918156 [Roridomyces roridus]